MRRILFFIMVISMTLPFLTTTAKVKYPGQKTYAYRYYLRDKKGGNYSINRPSHFLSAKSIERRRHQHLTVDSTDLPIPEKTIQLFRVEGSRIVAHSRWNNTIVVESGDTAILNRLALLPCVAKSKMVFHSPDSIDSDPTGLRPKFHTAFNRWDSVRADTLGMARHQIEMLGGDRLHEVDLKGRGMTIAILDGGFQNADAIPAFSKTKILGYRDFTPHHNGVSFSGIDHGTKVLSALAADAPEVMMGTAPEASYWLLRCEDPLTEQPIEEDYWAMAAEYADSAGADIINSSLGYNQFDEGMNCYRIRDLDGHTALISCTASMLARKGIILCNSAGNSGMAPWKKIGFPADASDILTVGAVNNDGGNAAFASVGPAHDGRVKPDVVALGSPTTLLSGRGTLIHDMGTSFSTPLISGLVACLWQGLPDKTALEIMDLVRRCSSQYDSPDNILGYGMPDFWRAFMIGRQQ